jgi:hypothetical protein
MSKLKKFLNSKAGKLVSSFAVGALKGVTGPVGGMIGGAFDGVKGEILNNVESKEGGEGKIDWSRLLGFIVAAIGLTYLAYSLFTGLITFDDFIKMVDNLIEVAS